MNKEKQIEEMAKEISKVQDIGLAIIESQMDSRYSYNREIQNEAVAEALYDAGYRKQSEGKWLKTDAYPHRVYCSLCFKTYVTNEEVIQGRSWQYPAYCTEAEYCPHCGAKMKGE